MFTKHSLEISSFPSYFSTNHSAMLGVGRDGRGLILVSTYPYQDAEQIRWCFLFLFFFCEHSSRTITIHGSVTVWILTAQILYDPHIAMSVYCYVENDSLAK